MEACVSLESPSHTTASSFSPATSQSKHNEVSAENSLCRFNDILNTNEADLGITLEKEVSAENSLCRFNDILNTNEADLGITLEKEK